MATGFSRRSSRSNKFQFSGRGSSSKALGPEEWGLALTTILLWGTVYYFTAEALEFMHPGTVVWLRVTFAFLFFLALPIKKRSLERSFGFKDWMSISIMGITWFALPYTLIAISQQWIDSSLAGMMMGANSLVTAVMASFFLRTLPTRSNSFGLGFGLMGIVVVAWPSLTSADNTTLGVILVFIAVLCYSFSFNSGIPLTQKWGSYFMTYWTLAAASIVTAPYGIYGIFQSEHNLKAYTFIAIMGAGGTALGTFSFNTLTARVGPTRGTSAVTFLVPLIALYAGSLIRHEDIHVLSLIGLALILIGLATITRGRDDRH